MAQGYYTLEEAAAKLGVTPDELNEMRKEGRIRAFADSGSWKFRIKDVLELVRIRELTSDPDLQLSDGAPAGDQSALVDDTSMIHRSPGTPDDVGSEIVLDPSGMLARPGGSRDADDMPTALAKSSKASGAGTDSGVSLSAGRPSGDAGSDSDVRLTDTKSAAGGGSGSSGDLFDAPIHAPTDSDIRLDMSDSGINLGRGSVTPPPAKGRNVSGILAGQGDGDGDFRFGVDETLGVQGEKRGEADSSPLLSPEPDASTGREMRLHLPPEGSSGDFALSDSDDDSVLHSPAASGINLGRPDDSGIALAGPKTGKPSDDTDFELSLDGDLRSGQLPSASAESESDFELALDEGDSDFTLDEEESGSEVVALDDSEDLDLDDGFDTDEGEEDLDEDYDEDEDEDYDEFDEEYDEAGDRAAATIAAGAQYAAPPAWPGWIVAPALLNTIVLVLVGVMVYEMVRNSWSYNTPHPMAGTLIQQVADISKQVTGGN